MTSTPEMWLQGPVPGVMPVLQPAAHALLQVPLDLLPILQVATPEQLWARPGGSASIGYHVVHLVGSLDRLFTYARGESLTSEQLDALRAERTVEERAPTNDWLMEQLSAGIDAGMRQLRETPPDAVLLHRTVGRQQLPSTTLGLLFHGAEHATRHAGQIRTLARILGVGAG